MYIFLFVAFIISFPLSIYCGFYWDDWLVHNVAFNRSFEEIKLFLSDRPSAAISWYLTGKLFPPSPLFHQVAGIFHKIIFSYLVSYFFKVTGAIREKKVLNYIPFLVFFFPGFSADSIALHNGNILIMRLPTIHIFSIIITYFAIKNKDNSFYSFCLHLASVLLMILQILALEVSLGLEIYRVILYFFMLSDNLKLSKSKVFDIIKSYSIYLFVSIGFIISRMTIIDTPRPGTSAESVFSKMFNEPIKNFFELFIRVIGDFYDSLIGVWLIPLHLEIFDWSSNESLYGDYLLNKPKFQTLLYIVIIIIAIIVGRFLHKTHGEIFNKDKEDLFDKKLLIISLIGPISLLFVWFGGREVVLNSTEGYGLGNLWDRYALIPLISSVSFLLFVFKKTRYVTFLFIIYIGLCINQYIHIKVDYIHEWKVQKSFFQQLFWRKPNLEKGNLVIVDGRQFKHQRDKHFSTILSYLYNGDLSDESFDYWLDFYPYWMGSKENFIAPKNSILRQRHTFKIDTAKINSVNFSDQTCLKIRNGARKDVDFNVDLHSRNRDMQFTENLQPPDIIFDIFGDDFNSNDCWCYYFQTADYHASLGNNAIVLEIYTKVNLKNFKPLDAREWLIFYNAAKEENNIKIQNDIKKKTNNSIYSYLFD